MLGVERLRLVHVGRGLERLVPPHVDVVVPGHVGAGTPDHEDLLDRAVAGDGGVDRGLQRRGRSPAVAPVGGDDDLGLGIEDAGAQRVGGEAAEHHRVRGTEPGAGPHRDDRLGNHRQVDRHPVALAHAQGLQGVGGPADLPLQLGVGERPGVTGLADEVDRHLVAAAGLDVPVDAVVRRVELAPDEPLGERRVVPVEGAGEVGGPGEVAAGLLGPEVLVVGVGGGVQVGPAVGLRRELLAGRELAVLVGQVRQGLVRHSVLQIVQQHVRPHSTR